MFTEAEKKGGEQFLVLVDYSPQVRMELNKNDFWGKGGVRKVAVGLVCAST